MEMLAMIGLSEFLVSFARQHKVSLYQSDLEHEYFIYQHRSISINKSYVDIL